MIAEKFWQQVEVRLITRETLYYIGGTLCVDNQSKPGGVALNLDGKGFVYSNFSHMKNSTLYVPKHIMKIVQEIYVEVKGEKRFLSRQNELKQAGIIQW